MNMYQPKRNNSRRIIQNIIAYLLVGVFILSSSTSVLAEDLAQVGTAESRARALLSQLTTEERVGQLFVVNFKGTDVGAATEIYDLIANHHIGGVILAAENDNFFSDGETITNAWSLINQVNATEFLSSQIPQVSPASGEPFEPSYIPLFIGLSQEGNGYPNDQIYSGLTPIPSQLAIGATWNPDLSEQVGRIIGDELSRLGINMLIGPSLDVVENPQSGGASDLGTRTFGGDPFWVGEMGRAYIRGVHDGSNNRIVVVAKHFPGLGSSDRLPDEEVATVRKSLEQLQQIELAPFFSVTGKAETGKETIDALLTSHIRYQGLQGNIRATTRPINFDAQAFELLMSLPNLNTWREEGGVMISDDLGSKAVRRFYDPTNSGFNALQPVFQAFIAGNDLLYLGDFFTTGQEDSTAEETEWYETITSILDFFTQKYQDDITFAQKVDDAVLRLLTMKFNMYGFFTLNLVLPPADMLASIGQGNQVTYEVARQGATLISPTIAELDSVLANPPERNDRIVILTDTYMVNQCEACPPEWIIPPDALHESIRRLYGPDGGGLVLENNLASFTFSDLTSMLDSEGNSSQISAALGRADWIIFMMNDVDADRPNSMALKRFLSERPDISRQKRMIVFALNAPYYLDATEISKLTAYYGLYSKTPAFIEVAARLIFKEIPVPLGALPVSVSGVGYDLITATSPDTEKTILILLDIPGMEIIEGITPEPLIIPDYQVGDQIPLRTGIILDSNGHLVPDGTPVQFVLSDGLEEYLLTSVETIGGIARMTHTVERSGLLEIRAIIEPAESDVLILDIPVPEPVEIEPTPTSPATQIATETLVPAEVVPTPTQTPVIIVTTRNTDLTDWINALLTITIISWIAYRSGAFIGKVRLGTNWGLLAFISGWAFYLYVSVELPGWKWVMDTMGRLGIPTVSLIGACVGWWTSALISLLSNRASTDSAD